MEVADALRAARQGTTHTIKERICTTPMVDLTNLTAPSTAVPFIDLQAPYRELREEIDAAVSAVLESGRYVLGTQLEAFEREFAAYCEAEHCVGVGNGLEALRLILEAYGIGPGDEVIVPAHTFIATWLAVSGAGATPVPVEPDERSFNIDPGAVAAVITPRTRAIIAVHLYGRPAEIGPLRELADRHGLALIEDAAQAHGARLHERRAGALADAAGFSFYPSKNLGAAGDGGAVTTNDPALAERVRLLRSYGSIVKYRHEERGGNSRLDEIQAALLRVKLRHLDAWTDRRREVARVYLEALAGVEGLTLPETDRATEPVWHLFVIRHKDRDALQARLADLGVATIIHYPIPAHRTGAYAGLSLGDRLPLTDRIAGQVLSLPIGPHLGDTQVGAVVRAVREAAGTVSRG